MIRTLLLGMFLLTAPGYALGARTVEVTVVTDEVFEQLPQWRGVIKSSFQKATKDFPQLAGWNLIIKDWRSVVPDHHDSYATALEEVAIETEFEKGILVYFAGRQYVQENLQGFALLDRRALAVSLGSRHDMTFTLRHELGHLMGLPHCPGKTIMAEIPTHRTWEFSPLAKDALAAVRGMALGNAPLFVGADIETLKEVHAAWSQAGFADGRILSRLALHLGDPVTTP